MNNKVLVELVVPDIEETYNVYLPVNRRIGNIVTLLRKAVCELTDGIYEGLNTSSLYNVVTGQKYDFNQLLIQTDIRNGTRIVLL